MDPLPGQLGSFADHPVGGDLVDAQPVGDQVLAGDCARNQQAALPGDKPASWWGFSLDHGEQAAVNDFRRRFGVDPEQLRRVPGALLAAGAGCRI